MDDGILPCVVLQSYGVVVEFWLGDFKGKDSNPSIKTSVAGVNRHHHHHRNPHHSDLRVTSDTSPSLSVVASN